MLVRSVRLVPLALLGVLSASSFAADSPPADGKVPITTSSEEARKLYVEGRDLQEKLRFTDARAYYQKAVAKDAGFALAHLGLANTAPSNKEFFDALGKAVAAAGKASEGERLLVEGFDAGVRSDPAGQKERYEKLVAAYPKDQRALNFLGNFHFGRQEWDKAVQVLERAAALDPQFSQPYNQMGYAYRFLGRYDDAEKAFKKYIELIPQDPNPYDSYAELLMKMGRYDESIRNYEKALALDPHFVASYVGIGLNQVFQGEPEKARATLAKLEEKARNTGERRQALARTAQSHLYQGRFDEALAVVAKMYAVAEGLGDKSAMAGDLNLMGNILLEAGRHAEAAGKFGKSLELSQQAATPDEVKQAARRAASFDEARVALARGDLAAARTKAKAYADAVAERKVPFEVWQTHEIAGLIALHEKDHDRAVAELRQANQQDPRVLFHLARALQAKGDKGAAKQAAREAAEHNGLNFNYAYVREKARKMAAEL
jgi:tetratricopeptide (TPR) repeat protein